MMWHRPLALAALLAAPVALDAQGPATRPPVIDLHMHTPMGPGPVESTRSILESRLASIDSLNVRAVMLTGVPDLLFAWLPAFRDRVRVIPGLLFPCVNGKVVMWGRPCFDHGGDWPDVDRLREHIEAGRVQALGEITTQFLGLGPSNLALEPYLTLADEYDLPVFIHMLPSAAGAEYVATETRVPPPDHRASAGDPLLLDEVLRTYPEVRVVVVHAGWPMADAMIELLERHPRVYAEIGLLQWEYLFPREEYHAFLERLVDAGFTDRILFGSDRGLAEGIDAILEADFLTAEQKRDILCGNAARFLGFEESVCR